MTLVEMELDLPGKANACVWAVGRAAELRASLRHPLRSVYMEGRVPSRPAEVRRVMLVEIELDLPGKAKVCLRAVGRVLRR